MPPLLQGRLFWKILVFFFLAQMTAVVGTGLAIWATVPAAGAPPPPPREMVAGPPEAFPPAPPGDMGSGLSRPPLLHLAAGTLVSLVFAALLAAYIARPVRRLRQALRAGASGQLTTDLTEAMGDRRDELADLCRDFDRMAQHIDQLMQGQRRLMHDVSHEMRSPLARLSAIVGLMRQQPARVDDCLNLLEQESGRMDRLVSELLTLSRLESGIVQGGQDVVDLAGVLAAVIADAAPEAEQAVCRLELAASAAALVRGDEEMLHRAFDNLLRNALAYAAGGGWIGIRLTQTHEAVCICVEDRGPGVLSCDLARLFEPFFRGSQVPVKKGHGLGLAIARQVVVNHGGRIGAENRREGGLRVTVWLPRVSSPHTADGVEEQTAGD